MDNSFEINGKQFKVGKINVLKQGHILRRIAPILSDLMPIAKKLTAQNATEDDQLAALNPIMTGISKLSDEDFDFVLLGLLGAVEIQQQNGWAYVAKGNSLMFEDLGLPMLLQIAGKAFMLNLSGFFAGTPRSLNGGG